MKNLIILLHGACGDSGAGASDYPVPEELVINSEPGREEFENQFGLKMGETGYVIDVPNKTALAVTLNEVTILDEFQVESSSDSRFYKLRNFTY